MRQKLLSYIFGVDNNTLFYKSLTESLELINPELDTTQAIEDNINTSNLQISEKENNKIPKATGLMKFSYGNNKRADVTSLTTLEAISGLSSMATGMGGLSGALNAIKTALLTNPLFVLASVIAGIVVVLKSFYDVF